MRLSTQLVLVLTVASAVLLSACGGGKVIVQSPTPAPTVVASAPVTPAPSTLVVTSVPPTPAQPVAVAVLGASPGPDFVRVEGYYNWLGDRYVWVPATWTKIPRLGATYVPGHWQATTGGYTWMPGYWQ